MAMLVRVKNSRERAGWVWLGGIGFLWAWAYCCWFVVLPGIDGTVAIFSIDYAVSITFNIVCLIAVPIALSKFTSVQALLDGRGGETYKNVRFAALSCAGITAGTVLLPQNWLFGSLSITGAVLTGVGTACMWVAWSNEYARVRVEWTEIGMAVSVLAIPVCCVVASLVFREGAFFFVAALPIASFACLRKSTGTQCEEFPTATSSAQQQAAFDRSFARVLVVACILHCAIGVAYAMMPGGISFLFSGGGRFETTIAAVCATAIGLTVATFAQRPDIYTMYRWLLPMVVFGLSLLSFPNQGFVRIGATCILASQFGYTMALWTFFARVAHSRWRTAPICMAFTHGFAQLGLALGGAVGGVALRQCTGTDTLLLFEVTSLCVCVCVATVQLFMGKESDFRLASDAQGSADVSESEDRAFDERAVARVFRLNCGLTEREEEVLILLAQGRSVPYIQEQLYISKNTVNTHVRHIYQKIGVRTKQELIGKLRDS